MNNYLNQILHGDALSRLRELPDESVNTVVTSPPYWGLRDYGVDGQIGLESTPQAFVGRLVAVFEEVHRVLREDGTLWLNLGDSYIGNGSEYGETKSTLQGSKQSARMGVRRIAKRDASLKPKNLVGIPWRVAFALQDAGWWLRSDIIWSKPNPMPESVTDRPTKSHEYIFLLSKSSKYFYDHAAVREMSAGGNNWPVKGGPVPNNVPQSRNRKTRNIRPGVDTKGGNQGNGSITFPEGTRNLRSVWSIPTRPSPEAHFATFPPALVERCIKAGCPFDGTVLDPFFGTGTVGLVARMLGRNFIGIELNQTYVEMAEKRLMSSCPLLMVG